MQKVVGSKPVSHFPRSRAVYGGRMGCDRNAICPTASGASSTAIAWTRSG